jgi:glutamate racemase
MTTHTTGGKPGGTDANAAIDHTIGIFDSGIGGLTVVRELLRSFPREGVVYFGDTARLPYGTKSPATVRRFSVENTHFLLNHGVDMIIVACNTSSAVALDLLRRQFDIPILGVVEPGARAAVAATRSGRVGVIGTVATIESGSYQAAIQEIDRRVEVYSAPCPLLVPLAEEGWVDHPVTRQVIAEYLEPLLAERIDALVLGCTHYPVLKEAIRGVAGDGVVLVDSAEEVVVDVARTPGATRPAATHTATEPGGEPGGGRAADQDEDGRGVDGGGDQEHAIADGCRYYVSDIPRRFRDVGGRFLGAPLEDVVLVDQTDLPWFERVPELAGGGR